MKTTQTCCEHSTWSFRREKNSRKMTFETKQNRSVLGLAGQCPAHLDNKIIVMVMIPMTADMNQGLIFTRQGAKYFKFVLLFNPHSKLHRDYYDDDHYFIGEETEAGNMKKLVSNQPPNNNSRLPTRKFYDLNTLCQMMCL